MSAKPLKEKLLTLQCHFTWNLELKDKVEVEHLLRTLALKLEHTECHNHGIYLSTKAYLYHRQGCYREALDSLQEAEAVLRREHPDSFSRQVLVTYGNYAWVYYHLVNYKMVELYLGRVRQICQSLSSPEPYSAQIPEIHAQKGWSLLAVGFRNGREAKKCFQTALREDESNREFQAGLAVSAFACWCHSCSDEDLEEATQLSENVVQCEPTNMEAKVHLVGLLKNTDLPRAEKLAEEVVRDSLDPEVLRMVSKFYKSVSLSRAISVLCRAVSLAPSYHLLHYNLGTYYKKQLEGALPEEKERIVADAIESFKRAVELDPTSVFARLELGNMYSIRQSPLYAEELYQNLLEELPTASMRCQQAIYLYWGNFLFYYKGLNQEALEMYKAGYAIPGGHPFQKWKLRGRVLMLAQTFQGDERKAIYGFVQEIENQEPGQCVESFEA